MTKSLPASSRTTFDDADLRERAVRRGRQGGDNDEDDATGSGSEGASGADSESRE